MFVKNKKGFTLIELLAVIVILAIIALIAVPIVMNLITKARMRVAETSTLKYISAIEYETAYSNMYNTPYKNSCQVFFLDSLFFKFVLSNMNFY